MIKNSFLAILLVLTLAIIYCKKDGQSKERKREEKKVKVSSSAQAQGTAIRFKVLKYVDKEGIGIEAFRFLIPSDWVFEGGIKWGLNNPTMPAVADFRARNPIGTEEFEVFPNQSFFWTDNQLVLYTFPIGSKYFGNEVRKPVGSLKALKNIILPRFRKNVSELKIVKEEELPELAKAVGTKNISYAQVSQSAEGSKIRIEYKKGDKLMEEEIYGVVEKISMPLQTMSGMVTNIVWIIDYLFSFKAEKGKLDSQAKLFQTIVYSFKLNPLWFSKYSQVIEYLAQKQIQQIRSIGELSKIISQTSNEISDMMMESYNQRQAVNDKISKNFSHYIRGVDEYHDPIGGKPVELPSGYKNAWSNSLGEYILSDDPNFNPNIGSKKNWQMMEKK